MKVKSTNWVAAGVVTGVKDLGSCASSWAFSVTGAIESVNAIATGNLISLSEQQLVDCSQNCDSLGNCNQGCWDGYPEPTFEYVM
jgi:xylem cysteine proteinase